MLARRMFSLDVVGTDSFLDLPVSARELYFQLGMRVDDEGFVGNPKSVARMVGASQDDLALLAAKGFLSLFDSGVCHVTHHDTNNYLRSDRRKDTVFQDEKALLVCDDGQCAGKRLTDGGQTTTACQPVANQPTTQARVSKSKQEQDKGEGRGERAFTPPSVAEVEAYAEGRGVKLDANHFMDYYMAQGWRLSNGNRMKDWRAAVRNWVKNDSAWAKPNREERRQEAVNCEYANDF